MVFQQTLDVQQISNLCASMWISNVIQYDSSSSNFIPNRIQQYNTVYMTNITNSRVIIDIVMWFCWWPPEKPWAYQAGSHRWLVATDDSIFSIREIPFIINQYMYHWNGPWGQHSWTRNIDPITVETLYSTIYYSKYFIELHIDKSTQYVALWTHKRHPIPRPFGRAMECLLWVLQQKLTVL